MMEFHISLQARERYRFAESLFSYNGNVVFGSMGACRDFAHRMNTVREAHKHPERAVHAGQLWAMGLIDEVSHILMARYREQFDPEVMTRALDWFGEQVGSEAVDALLLAFVEQFPGQNVMRGIETPAQWLAGTTGGNPHRAAALEELLLLWTANSNQAFRAFDELFEDKSLAEKTAYRRVTARMPEYFRTRPLIPVPDAKPFSLLDLLRAPAEGAPTSLSDQLALIRALWKPLLGEDVERFVQVAGEILREEELAIWMQYNPPAVQARAAAEAAAIRRQQTGSRQWPATVSTADVPVFGDPANEYEKFSPDTAWMPTTVLIAKSTYVWLAQMSRQYGRHIDRLDEIPDEELAVLARRGINTLWLIGVWERSRASKTIKQLCGNRDAVASAYSLFDYTIADDLGGESAYVNLRDRAYRNGVRLASDMVPNHMGIDSPWVVEHPEWFMARSDSPYPAYTFNGPDLSSDGRVEIKIEDHYFEQTDAAVVFQRRDKTTGEIRYVYHGNDGTSFPWNDTAQLDYLNPAVREQVIQTILHVARLFPVIRFDAAMTLAKRHFHRLWFPGPGASGAIPSRAEYGMSQADFDRAMPHEFWREVVDRVAAEVPGTLLLAEAFWLMEGYFVRTLGMHRVYNSAFMVMLRDEDNAKYRSVLKNTLEFDPDIMKRYVNFMSNPDERTAIDQFGKGDKCFGVTAMMATLPGLPMFGHGQIEGFTEKYGMEYRWPRYNETPDRSLVERHDREIAPLLKRRWLFAESENFLLYDFFTASGAIDEDVYAYSNRSGGERALIVYNNRYGSTRGTIDNSAAFADKESGQLKQRRLREGLGLTGDAAAVLAFRDSLTGLEYLRRASELRERGLTLELGAYQSQVFLDWRELKPTARQPWDKLSDQLAGRGVANLDDALVDLGLRPAHDALRKLLDPAIVRQFADLAEHPRPVPAADRPTERERGGYFDQLWDRAEKFLKQAQTVYASRLAEAGQPAALTEPIDFASFALVFRRRLRAAMRLPGVESLFPSPWPAAARRMLPSPSPEFTATSMWGPILAWCALELLADAIDAENPERAALDLYDRLRLREPFARAFASLGFEGEAGWRAAARIKVVLLTGAGVGAQEAGSVTPSPITESKAGVGYVAPGSSPVVLSASTLTDASVPVSDARDGESEPAVTSAETPSIVLARDLWLDPDVRWLTGVHEVEGHEYLVRERYEELLWWMLLPSLLKIASQVSPDRAAVEVLSRSIDDALATAEEAGYRVDKLQSGARVDAGPEREAQQAEEPVPEEQKAEEPDPAVRAAEEGQSAPEGHSEPEAPSRAQGNDAGETATPEAADQEAETT